MNRCSTPLIAASLLLAAQAAWALPPYYPQARYAYAAPMAPVYGYPRPAAMRQPRQAYPSAPMAYRFPARPIGLPRPLPPVPTDAGSPGHTTAPSDDPPAAAGSAPVADVAPPDLEQSEATAATGEGDHRAEFLQRLRPLVEKENARLLALRDELSGLLALQQRGAALSRSERKKVQDLARRYRVEGNPLDSAQAAAELLGKVDVVPVSLALAQAANESAWGKSRFAREGNNLFGIWTYDESKGIVPRKRQPGKKHLVRRFDSIADSVRYYIFTLNSHPAYAELRAIRAERRDNGQPPDGHSLADGLTRYSAKGQEYVRLIRDMIRRFDLAAFDARPEREA